MEGKEREGREGEVKGRGKVPFIKHLLCARHIAKHLEIFSHFLSLTLI